MMAMQEQQRYAQQLVRNERDALIRKVEFMLEVSNAVEKFEESAIMVESQLAVPLGKYHHASHHTYVFSIIIQRKSQSKWKGVRSVGRTN